MKVSFKTTTYGDFKILSIIQIHKLKYQKLSAIKTYIACQQ
ncbi:hypothetical protein MTBBW1_2130081 [Desulfamplus magnetovallimortis]|uniref:Uncharacterized protein n=1 Tax=Desulfamplus magnetovallimortis TaxID=1246637 RepID=A0A1W1HCM3_9BACT|nr:hypothetical protein MTBBW1_2130081 [Desulfamplus magnetovallimortis]